MHRKKFSMDQSIDGAYLQMTVIFIIIDNPYFKKILYMTILLSWMDKSSTFLNLNKHLMHENQSANYWRMQRFQMGDQHFPIFQQFVISDISNLFS